MSGPYIGCHVDERGAEPRSYSGPKHLLTVGPPGSGKSMRLIAPNLALLDRAMVIIDVKGELAAMSARHRRKFGPVYILDPFKVLEDQLGRPLKSSGFNPLALLDPDSDDFVDDTSAYAEGLIKIQGQDPHWTEGGQDFACALIMHVVRKARQAGEVPTLGTVRQLLTRPRTKAQLPDGSFGITGTIAEMLESDYAPIQQKSGRFFSDNDETLGIISAAIGQTKFLDSPQIARDTAVETGVDFSELREQSATVYLVLPQNRLSTHANWLRLVVASALRALTQKPKRHDRPNVLFILDEFAQLGHLQTIADCLANTRGFGITLWPILQDLLQLKQHYNDMWEVFLGTSGMITAFTPQTMFTAEYLSKRSGSHEVEKPSRNSGTTTNSKQDSENKGISWSPYNEPLFRPEQFFGLPEGQMIGFMEYMQHPMMLSAPWYDWLPWCSVLDRNPYLNDGPRH